MSKDESSVLKIGSSINIKRTDGRIHSAFVAGINYDLRSATVEWFENGETKGKEIDMATVQSLNPELSIVQPDDAVVTKEDPPSVPSVPSTLNVIQRDSSTSSDVYEEAEEEQEEENSGSVARSGHSSHKLDESDDDFNSNELSLDTTTLSNPTRQSIPTVAMAAGIKPVNGSMRKSRQPRLTQNTNTGLGTTVDQPCSVHSAQPVRTASHVTTSRSQNAIAQQPQQPQQPQQSQQQLQQNLRRSNVVKEVEKLKKNREERRQRQAEEKAEKEAFLQLAPGNPHWELLNMILEYRKNLEIRPLTEHDAIEDHLITVCVRKRPLNKKEMTRKEVDVITVPSKNQLIVHEPKNKVDLTKYLENQLFRFDYAFDESCSNAIVYKYTAQPLVKTIFEGGFSTCFAYGQTGSGKTHTMGGDFTGKNQDCKKGIYALVAADVFKLNASSKYSGLKMMVCTSFFEIYSGKVFDLLNHKAKLRILEDGKQQVQVVGLTERTVTCVDQVLKIIQEGNGARTSGQTSANANSSRSHAIFQIILRRHGSLQNPVHGKFSLIDLAGNERGADTSSANRQTRMEGAEINKSLLALKECIRALGRKGSHLPFRVSKLTQVLRDSFVGNNARTCMIAMISPGVSSCEHSLNTLRYADRVKELGGGDLQQAQADGSYENQKLDEGDLSQLRSLSEQDMTPELFNFHQVVTELQTAEDTMLEVQKQTTEFLAKSVTTCKSLLELADDVAYDQELYCNAWDGVIDNTMAILLATKAVVTDYKAKMAAEEQLSRRTGRK